jgi:hypothetical protein
VLVDLKAVGFGTVSLTQLLVVVHRRLTCRYRLSRFYW